MPEKKHGKIFFTNEEITGVSIEFYHVPKNVNPQGGPHKFGVKVVLPEIMESPVDWDRAKEDEEYRKSFAADSLMMHVDGMEKTLAMHPDCIEVTDFYGKTHSVHDMGLDTLVEGMMKDMAMGQYEEEKARGIVPNGMTFEEWCEVASPDPNMNLSEWTPNGDPN